MDNSKRLRTVTREAAGDEEESRTGIILERNKVINSQMGDQGNYQTSQSPQHFK